MKPYSRSHKAPVSQDQSPSEMGPRQGGIIFLGNFPIPPEFVIRFLVELYTILAFNQKLD